MNGLRIIQALCPPPSVYYTVRHDADEIPTGDVTFTTHYEIEGAQVRVVVGDDWHERVFEYHPGEGWMEVAYYPATYMDPPGWDYRPMSALEVVAVLATYTVPVATFVPVMDMILSTEGSQA